MTETESLGSSLADLSSHLEAQHHSKPELLHRDDSHQHANILMEESFGKKDGEKELDSETPGDFNISIQKTPSKDTVAATLRVPNNERRGILGTIALLPEYYDARSYSPRQKLVVVCIVAFAAIAGPMGTSIMLPAVEDISTDLDTSITMVNVSVGIYLLSLGIFPLWWSNFSERHGRRSVYVISFIIFFAFSIGCALAPSIGSLIVLRLLAGVGSSAVQACGAGTISDLYVQEERGSALGLFYLGPLLGPFISPILGGAVAIKWGWRATMWVMVIMGGINVLSIVFLLPETLLRENVDSVKRMIQETFNREESISACSLQRIASNISQNTSLRRQILDEETPIDFMGPTLSRYTTTQSDYSRRIRDRELADLEIAEEPREKNWFNQLYDYVVRPLHALVFLTYPPILLCIGYSSIAFMGIYFFNITISNSYSEAPYNFSPVIVGLMYVPNSISYIITSIYGGKWLDWLIQRSARKNNGELQPESRISWNSVAAILTYPPACLIFGWCLDKQQHWVTPLIGTALFGFSSVLVIGTTTTYLTDLLPGKGATGIALNNLVRQILAATATFITKPLISALGVGVLFCIYAGVVTLAAGAVWVLKKKGGHFREKYDITQYYAKL